MNFKLQKVKYMPAQLEPGILYVSDEFEIAVHLCACGCGEKIRTPLGPTEWKVSVEKRRAGPSVWPSIGNWQLPCHSHYIIRRGNVIWCNQWTPEEITAGRHAEEERRARYYESRRRFGWNALREWTKRIFRRER
jgi:hypothetical protein